MKKGVIGEIIPAAIVCGIVLTGYSFYPKTNNQSKPYFKKHVITTDFISEGVAVADVNKDGKIDVLAGSFWFEAPHWKRHEIAPGQTFDPTKSYSNSFLNFTLDVNHDGWQDFVLIDFPGKSAVWYENPKNKPGHWNKHAIFDHIGISNESPAFVDVDNDGRLDILCGNAATKEIVWLQAPPNKNTAEWKCFPISKKNASGTDIFSHGLGFGDLNNDGKKDVIIKNGWWENPGDPKQPDWTFHEADLGEDCSHMYALDVNNDKLNDVISASAHRLGIWWHQQLGNNLWKTHLISEAVSQTHSTILADLNRDGKPDLITGKRYLAHHDSSDPGTHDPSLLLWFESMSAPPYWITHEIDNDSGAGLNIVAQDINNDGRIDIIIANKKGVFFFENKIEPRKTK